MLVRVPFGRGDLESVRGMRIILEHMFVSTPSNEEAVA